jgi:hypothetical protein
MADEKQSGSGLGGNSVIVLLVAAASAVYMGWQKPPLVSSRPTDLGTELHDVRSPQNVDARLWQDPFAAVRRYIDDKRNVGSKSDSIHTIDYFREHVHNGPTLLLAVSMSGAPYPEAAENRRRLRYAVLAGLHVLKYEPEDEKHIGYFFPNQKTPTPDTAKPQVAARAVFNIGQPTGTSPSEVGKLDFFGIGTLQFEGPPTVADTEPLVPAVVPFEVFDNSDHPSKGRVAVLWLDEDEVSEVSAKPLSTPLTNLFQLLCAVKPSSDEKFAVLGPQDSTTLMAMARQIKEKRYPKCPDGSKLLSASALPLFNYGATADLNNGATAADLQPVLDPENWPPEAGIRYSRNISSDQEVAKTLAGELSRRGVDLKCSDLRTSKPNFCDHIALISERDTVYGRFLHDTMSQTLASDKAPIKSYSYLRGLDGRSANPKAPKNDDASGGKDSDRISGDQTVATPETASHFESAEGQSQFDYLRRIAEKIREKDHELRWSGRGRIAAIGVLGSDVYDKLLILQALRPILPDTIYFTTDLDELLLPEKKSLYTRNLLVASSYGLALDPSLQLDIPRFRNTYQTSIFLATQRAINEAFPTTESHTKGVWKKGSPDPRLFEIGRADAYPLPTQADEPASKEHRSVQPDVTSFRFNLPTWGPLFSAFILVFIMLDAIFLSTFWLIRQFWVLQDEEKSQNRKLDELRGLVNGRRPRHPRKSTRHRISAAQWANVLIVSITLLLSIAVCWWSPAIAAVLTERGLGEPVSLVEGISLWPTILLRLVGSWLSLWLTGYTLLRVKTTLQRTQWEMQLPTYRPRWVCKSRQSISDWLDEIATNLWFPQWRKELFQDGRPERDYCEFADRFANSNRARLIRAVIGTLLVLSVWWILVEIFGQPQIPARGPLARTIFNVVTFIDMFTTVFLIFLVADALIYLRTVIKRLTAVRIHYDQITLGKFEQDIGLLDKDGHLDDWIDMQFLWRRTRCVNQFVYFPFLAFAILIVSQNIFFDNFTFDPALVTLEVVSLAVIIASVLALRWAAEDARSAACEQLTSKIIAAKGRRGVEDAIAGQLELVLSRVENLREGAFAPLSGQPIVRAVLLPLLTYGGTVLLHAYALPGF